MTQPKIKTAATSEEASIAAVLALAFSTDPGNWPPSMCRKTSSVRGGVPPPLTARPARTSECEEAYQLWHEYKVKYEGAAGASPKVGSSLEEKAYADIELVWRKKYYYDARGRLLESIGYHVHGPVERRVYTYAGDARAPKAYELQVDGRTALKEWLSGVRSTRVLLCVRPNKRLERTANG